MYAFELVWHILSKGQFNRGKDNNKLLIGTSKTGDHGCLIEVTAKKRSVFTIIRGSYLKNFDLFDYKGSYSSHPLIRTCGLRTSWQKFATLIPKNTRTCLAKQNQAGSYMCSGLQLNYDNNNI